MRRLIWILVHHLIAHPLLLIERLWTTRFHDWTAERAWPDSDEPIEGEDVARANVGELLCRAEGVADEAGLDLVESLATLHLLWAVGYDREARKALDRSARTVREALATPPEGGERTPVTERPERPRGGRGIRTERCFHTTGAASPDHDLCRHGKRIGDDCGLCELQGPDRQRGLWSPGFIERFDRPRGEATFTVVCAPGFERRTGQQVFIDGADWEVVGWDDHRTAASPIDGEVIAIRVRDGLTAKEARDVL